MNNLGGLLKESAPKELRDFVKSCTSEEALVNKIGSDLTRIVSVINNMNIEGNESLASRLLYHINSDDFGNSDVKKVEIILRNGGYLNREIDTDCSLIEKGNFFLNAHRLILGIESEYFRAMFRGELKESIEGSVEINDSDIDSEVYDCVVEYLYLSDEDRKEFVSTVGIGLLPMMATLADQWCLETLREACDEELCNLLPEFGIEKEELEDWLTQAHFLPKFAMLLEFIDRVAQNDDFKSVIEKMQTLEGAAQLAGMCTPEEIRSFATLKTEFGKACRLPKGAFGKAEWEKIFPVTIEGVPPLPVNMRAILEQDDPWEPGKTLMETCMLFLRPEKVLFHGNDGIQELQLSFSGVEKLAQEATDPERRARYNTTTAVRYFMMNYCQVAESGWVLMRKEVIPGSRRQRFENQKQLLKDGFEVPKVMDAILLNFINYASEGKCLYGQNPCTYTRCQEKYGDFQVIVGGFASSELYVNDVHFDYDDNGLSGSWKF